ncbi:MAG: ABC-F family ATP-binding cassette domain-containing protein [Planctomycetes bacterium]|nr:ABC-F family ATP-binding cassette domain-containing protein [Planctomycetota bacterium]
MISVQGLSKSYGEQVLFDDASFVMTPGERLGLIGRNGYGKSTLFRILLGEEHEDDGSIVLPKQYRIGHLSQHLRFDEPTILDEVCKGLKHREHEAYRAEAALMGLGFTRDDLLRHAHHFSGGYQIRVNLARVLVEEPNLLLLDEPTNYLDITSVRWLTRFLRGWPNEMILITHDRAFMDSVCTHTMLVHRSKLRRMEGTVDKLLEQVATEEEVYENTRQNEEKKRRQDERFIERFRAKASKATLVKSRQKLLDKRGRMDELETERDLDFRFNPAPFHATVMMSVDDLAFGFDDGPPLMEGLSFALEKGDRVAIIGPNGKGKTTLLNLLAGELQPRAGTIKLNPNTQIAYFGQTNIDRLHPQNTVEEEILAVQPDNSRTVVRTLAGMLMFSGDAALKTVSVLSGGERSRVLLGKLLVSPANLLLLDEPTNHLDMPSIEALLDAVDAFPGAVLLVTHSEMILERLATRLVVFDGGKATLFESGYRDFLERVGWRSESDEAPRKPSGGPKPVGKDLRKARAEIVAARTKATAALKTKVDVIEARIERLERQIDELDEEMSEAAAEGRAGDIGKLAADAKKKRLALDADWELLERAQDELDVARAEWDIKLGELE